MAVSKTKMMYNISQEEKKQISRPNHCEINNTNQMIDSRVYVHFKGYPFSSSNFSANFDPFLNQRQSNF